MLFATAVQDALTRFQLHDRGDAPFPRQPAPMLVEKAATLFDDPAWTYEPKWDGFRVLASVREGSVRLISRNGHSFTNLFWPVSDALRGFPTSILLDGEVIDDQRRRTTRLRGIAAAAASTKREAARVPVLLKEAQYGGSN